MAGRNLNPKPYARLYEHIEYDILAGVFKVRERLVESDLMAKYNASRGAIRNVLKELEKNQLVTHTPNRGAEVRELSLKEMEDVYNLRLLLENYALEISVPNIDPGALAQVEICQKDFEKAIEQGRLRDSIDSNVRFHQTIYKASDNAALCEMIAQLRRRSHLWQQYLIGHPTRLKKSIEEHWMMCDCLKNNDLEGIKELNRLHITSGYNGYIEDQRRRIDSFQMDSYAVLYAEKF